MFGLLLVSSAHADLAPDDPPEVTACADKQAGDSCELSGKPGTCRSAACNRLDYSKGSPPRVIESQCLDCVAAADAPPAAPSPASAPAVTPPASPAVTPPAAAETVGRCRIDPTSIPAWFLLTIAFIRRREASPVPDSSESTSGTQTPAASSMSRLALILPLVVLAALVASYTAHAGNFPLFIIVRENPWMLGLGAVLLVLWFVMRSRD